MNSQRPQDTMNEYKFLVNLYSVYAERALSSIKINNICKVELISLYKLFGRCSKEVHYLINDNFNERM